MLSAATALGGSVALLEEAMSELRPRSDRRQPLRESSFGSWAAFRELLSLLVSNANDQATN
jgi:hypothetical protein